MFESTLSELLYGKGAHANPIACVEDLSAILASRTLDGFPHSTWQLVNHMNYWMEYELHRIAGACPAYPEHASASWLPNSAPPAEADWTKAVARFRELIAKFAEVAHSGAQALSRVVQSAHLQQGQHGSTVGAILWQVASHNSYHTGQIAVLRRHLNAWPPQSGGDTW
jgi:uncharacterized damage-inducible protein DinB